VKLIASALALISLSIAGAAFAQEATPEPFVGKWRAEWVARSGKTTQADLDLPASGPGSWHTFGNSRSNTCAGKVGPVYVQEATAEQVVLMIKMSETVASCEDSKLTLKANPGGAPAGQWRSGGAVTISPR